MAKARRERHSIEARVEREKAAAAVESDAVEPDDTDRDDAAVAETLAHDESLVHEDVVEETPLVEETETSVDDAEQPPTIDQDTAVALAVEAARPDSVTRQLDPIRVASDTLDREEAEAEAEALGSAEDAPSRPRDAVSASLSDRAAAQLAKRRRREEERAARDAEKAEKAEKTEKAEVSAPTAPIAVVTPASTDGSGRSAAVATDSVRQAARTAWDVPEPRGPRAEGESGSSKIWSTVVSVVGIAGYVCAVLLAVGAMTVALGLENGDAIFDLFSPVCDVLVSPARGLVSFSGDNAETKELFLAYSVGSIVYLVIGLVAQNLPKRQD